jgi:flagellar basal-body rod protein FlgB
MHIAFVVWQFETVSRYIRKGNQMADLFIFDKTYDLLGKSLGVSAKRQSMITGNISNVDSLEYEPKDLDFKKTLEMELRRPQRGLSGTNPRHIRRASTYTIPADVRKSSDEMDSESVNIDTEMVNLMENNLKYRTSVEMLLRKISILRHSITEGGR